MRPRWPRDRTLSEASVWKADHQHRALALEVGQAKYHAALAARRYDALDPDNRLVTAEREARWNGAIKRAGVRMARARE